jgi:hypothetical protein
MLVSAQRPHKEQRCVDSWVGGFECEGEWVCWWVGRRVGGWVGERVGGWVGG